MSLNQLFVPTSVLGPPVAIAVIAGNGGAAPDLGLVGGALFLRLGGTKCLAERGALGSETAGVYAAATVAAAGAALVSCDSCAALPRPASA